MTPEERAKRRAEERARVAAMHVEEHERHWALLSPESRATAVARGWGGSLLVRDRKRITGKK